MISMTFDETTPTDLMCRQLEPVEQKFDMKI